MKTAKGQTIIEFLIAMTVISVGLLSAVALVYHNLGLVERDVDQVVAVNMAREGVELAKAARDSNWLAGNAFDLGLANGADYTATPVWNGEQSSYYFDFAADNMSHANAKVIFIATSTVPAMFANANVALPISGTSTGYSRLITLHPICDDFSVLDSGFVCTPKSKIGVRVESRIEWVRKGASRNFTIYEDLYDWR